jgi:hypothetical protein
MVITGIGFTVTVTEVGALAQPLSVYTTLYVVVAVGLTLILAEVALLAFTDQRKVPPRAEGVAVSVACCPAQIAAGVGTVTVGIGFTTIFPVVEELVAEHPLSV